MVDARRGRPVGCGLWASSSSLGASLEDVRGVEGESEPFESDSREVAEPLKSKSVTERDRTPRGSSGIGLSGWEVDETGISWKVLLRRPATIVADGMIVSTA